MRGADLLDSTPRQILLQKALGLSTPAYLHLPLVLDAKGRKQGKSDDALAVDAANPAATLGRAFGLLGQDPRAIAGAANAEAALRQALAHFDPGTIPVRMEERVL